MTQIQELAPEQDFSVRKEQTRGLLHFIPNYPPEAFSKYLQLLTLLRGGEDDLERQQDFSRPVLDDVVQLYPTIRNVYDRDVLTPKLAEQIVNDYPQLGLTSEEVLAVDRVFPNLLVYNQQEGPESKPSPITLNDEQYTEIRQLAHDFLRNHTEDVIVCGFAGERTSIRGCLEAAIHFVGEERVIATDTGKDPEATDQAKQAGCKILDQQRINISGTKKTKSITIFILKLENI